MAGEGVPAGLADGVVGVEDFDDIDGEPHFGGLADGEVVAEGGFGSPLDLGAGEGAGGEGAGGNGFFGGGFIEAGVGADEDVGVLDVEVEGAVAGEDEVFAVGFVDHFFKGDVVEVELGLEFLGGEGAEVARISRFIPYAKASSTSLSRRFRS